MQCISVRYAGSGKAFVIVAVTIQRLVFQRKILEIIPVFFFSLLIYLSLICNLQ